MKHFFNALLFLNLFSFTACQTDQKLKSSSPLLHLENLTFLGEVDERYQSINIEMCEVVGGEFWVPYPLIDMEKVQKEGFAALKHPIPAIDLYDEKLRNLAMGLGPMYVRVSGTWANTTYFQNNDKEKLAEAPDGYENVLTQKEWRGVIDFCKATQSKLVTSFAISDGIRDKNGRWTPTQIKPLIEYTRQIRGEIYAAEMFNEPSHASHGGAPHGYDASDYAEDFAAFQEFVSQAAPNMKIMGPGSTGEGGILGMMDSTMTTDQLLSALPEACFDIFSYHYYGDVSQRCSGQQTPEKALTPEWLSKTEKGLAYYEKARDQYLPQAPIWLTETAEAACGGNPWAATYVDVFRYLEQLGRLAQKGVQVVMHNTLATSEYALLDQDTHDPRPNYWAAYLWNQLMGHRVYQSITSLDDINVYVHNQKNKEKGFSALLINPTDSTIPFTLNQDSEQYLLSSKDPLSKEIFFNGSLLQLNNDNTLPILEGNPVKAGEQTLPPMSILFFTFTSDEQ